MKSILSLLLFLSTIITIRAETLYIETTANDTAWVLSIVGVYQVDDEIWITSDLERAYAGAWAAISTPYDTLELDVPAMLAKHVGDLSEVNSPNPLYLRRKQVGTFDFSQGDGWVDTSVAGWLFIRQYPWVFHSELGWLYATQGTLTNAGDAHFRLSGPPPSSMSYYFYSKTYGLLWKSPYKQSYYSYNQDAFLTVDQLKAL